MTSQSLLRLALALALCLAPVAAQQLEPNTPGGSCTVNGQGPTGVGTPIPLYSAQSASIVTSGGPSLPYTLFLGNLAPASINFGGEFLDIDLLTATTYVDGLNFGFGGFLPSILGVLDTNGQASLDIAMNPNAVGLQVAMQGAVLDASTAVGINITGAPEFQVIPGNLAATIVGDDIGQYVSLLTPINLYGNATSSVYVSTNGWVSLSQNCTFSDLAESSADVIAGTIGGAPAGDAPVVCALWDDLDMGNGIMGQELTVFESPTGQVTFTWNNADEFPTTPIGTFGFTIDNLADTVTFDYSGYTGAQIDGIVGITDGGWTGFSTPVEWDLVAAGSGGVVNGYASSGVETLYQDFGAGVAVPPETVDLSGAFMTWIGASTGVWTVF